MQNETVCIQGYDALNIDRALMVELITLKISGGGSVNICSELVSIMLSPTVFAVCLFSKNLKCVSHDFAVHNKKEVTTKIGLIHVFDKLCSYYMHWYSNQVPNAFNRTDELM